MKAISEELKELMQSERPFRYTAQITLRDGTELTLTEDDLAASGCRIISSAGSSSFPVGYAISKCLTLAFFNPNERFADYDFLGAEVAITASVELSDSTETIDLDHFTITEPEQYGTTITITGYDDMHLADVPYNSALVFPTNLQSVYREACQMCGLIPIASLTNGSFTVDEAPVGLTCRQVLALVAQLAGGNVISDHYTARIVKYEAYNANTAHDLAEVIQQTASTDDVVITGVRLKASAGDIEAGSVGYLLEFSNVLTKGHETEAANLLSALYTGLRFRPFEQQTMSYPIADFADPCTVYVGGIAKQSYINDITFDFRGTTTLKCAADSPVRNASKSSQTTKVVQELREVIREERTARQAAEQDLSDRIAASGGLYSTVQTTAQGNTYYLHNKPTLAASSIIWRMTEEAFAVSTNGGQTWNAGLTVDGVFIAQLLESVGVDADWITAGKFDVENASGDTIFSADKDNGSVYISGDNVFIGERSVTEALSDISGTLTLTLSNEMQAIPTDSEGHYDTFPAVSTSIQVFYSGTDVTAQSTITYSEFNVSGTYSNHTYTPSALTAENGYVTFSARYDASGQILTASRKFNLFKVRAGAQGDPGSSRLFFLDADTAVITQSQSGGYSPSVIHFNAFYRDGNETERHPYTGVFQVDITRDGENWETVEYPEINKTGTTYTPEGQVKGVRCYLYSYATFEPIIYAMSYGSGVDQALISDGGEVFTARQGQRMVDGGDLLDTSTVTTVIDASELTQEQIFSILTRNGAVQGLYLYQGEIYFNAGYLSSGIIASKDGATKWNLDTGDFTFNPQKSRIGTGTNAESLQNVLTRISTTESGLTSEVSARTSGDSALSTRITQNANAITTKVTSGEVESLIEQNASSIRLKTTTLTWKSTNSEMASNGTITTILNSRKAEYTAGTVHFYARQEEEVGGIQQWGDWSNYGLICANSWMYSGSTGDVKRAISSGDDPYEWSIGNFLDAETVTGFTVCVNNAMMASITSKLAHFSSTTTQTKALKATTLTVSGTKNRIAQTEDYGRRLLYCYETASPMFGDIGEGEIGEDGKAFIPLDPTFSETVNTGQYQVFLQMYGAGTAYVSARKPGYFVVEGTPGLSFGWEIKAKQADFDQLRMEQDIRDDLEETDFGVQAVDYLTKISTDYGTEAISHIEDINGGRTA